MKLFCDDCVSIETLGSSESWLKGWNGVNHRMSGTLVDIVQGVSCWVRAWAVLSGCLCSWWVSNKRAARFWALPSTISSARPSVMGFPAQWLPTQLVWYIITHKNYAYETSIFIFIYLLIYFEIGVIKSWSEFQQLLTRTATQTIVEFDIIQVWFCFLFPVSRWGSPSSLFLSLPLQTKMSITCILSISVTLIQVWTVEAINHCQFGISFSCEL